MSEKRQSTIPVFVITGIGILLLTTIIGKKKWISHSEEDKRYHLSLVAHVNNLNTTWKLLKSKKLNLPKQFDARLQWPLCWSIHQVANQGECGSCWAVSAASVMSDRLCIATNYSNQNQISAEDLISCCDDCGGCQGTEWALSAFIYWRDHGIVTGGNYGSSEGCKPYTISSNCGIPCSPEDYQKKIASTCQRTCQPLYSLDYEDDLISSQKAYFIRIAKFISAAIPSIQQKLEETIGDYDIVELIKREIYLYGPALACFTASVDFQHYHSGIYHIIDDNANKNKIYGHCVKILGWGEENNHKYWLYMNTWGRNWGDYGFFRVDLSELPEDVIGGLLYND
ncbi:Papain family cysteine protease [Dirofilaria immitis]|nr:Papain family cysteine protease [Dirofilaria immitis]